MRQAQAASRSYLVRIFGVRLAKELEVAFIRVDRRRHREGAVEDPLVDVVQESVGASLQVIKALDMPVRDFVSVRPKVLLVMQAPKVFSSHM